MSLLLTVEGGFLAKTGRKMSNLLGMNETQVPGNKDISNRVEHQQEKIILYDTTTTTEKSLDSKVNDTMKSLADFNAMEKYIYNVFAVILITLFVFGAFLFGCWVTEQSEDNFYHGWGPHRGNDPPYKYQRTDVMKIDYVDDPKPVKEEDIEVPTELQDLAQRA
jgi:hypothetical protein